MAEAIEQPLQNQPLQQQVPQIPDYGALARQTLEMQKTAIEPQVSALQQTIPTTQAKFAQQKTSLEAERQPLVDRYQNIINEISRLQEADIGDVNRVTSREFARRGVPISSGLVEQTLQERVSPIRQSYAGQIGNVGIEREAGLRDLATRIAQSGVSEQEAINQITGQIAGMQTGAGQEAMRNALALYQTQGELGVSERQLAQQQAQFASQQAQQESQFGRGLGMSQAELAQQALQFGQQQGLTREQMAQQQAQFGAGQSQQESQFGRGFGLSQQELTQRADQFA